MPLPLPVAVTPTGGRQRCPRFHPTLLLALAALALAPAAAAADDAPCWHPTHFAVTGGTAECSSKCEAKLAAAKGVGSIWPETYKPADTVTCCKCQYRRVPFQGDPSPASTPKPAGDTTPDAPSEEDSAGDDDVLTDAALAQQQDDAAAGKTKPAGLVWWKVVISCSILALIIAVVSGFLIWDCCRKRRKGEEVAEVRDSVRATMAKSQGKKEAQAVDGRKKLSEAQQQRMAALDLALEMRQTKMEAQRAGKFQVAVTAGAPAALDLEEAATGTSTSLPASPARSRLRNPFA